MGGHNKITNKTSLNNILYVRGESRIDFCRQSHNEGGGGGGITNDVLKFRKIIEFQSSWIAMSCQWIVYSYTKNAKSA